MPRFEFTLIADTGGDTLDDVEEKVYEAGCDDALLGYKDGVAELDFTREAKTWLAAIVSAIEDVTKAGYSVIRFGPDLVSTPEVAQLLNVTRANVLQLMKGKAAGGRGEGDFAKAIEQLGGRPIFRMRDVAEWATRHHKLSLEQFLMAQGIAYGNNVLERYRLTNRKLSSRQLVEALRKAPEAQKASKG